MPIIKKFLSALAEYKKILKFSAKAISIGFINQLVSSGGNFALGIFLLKVLSSKEFGLYGIGFAVSLLYSGVVSALISTQMLVHAPEKKSSDLTAYAARMLVALILFCLLTTIGLIALLIIISILNDAVLQYQEFIFSILAAAIAYASKEFFVTYAYTARKEFWVSRINITVVLTLASLLVLQVSLFNEFNAERGLWIYAASHFIGVITGLVLVKLPIADVRFERMNEEIWQAWRGGKWALVGVGIIWAQTQAYIYITAIFIGPVGVAYANSTKLLITPLIFGIQAVSQILMPRIASIQVSNPEKILVINKQFTVAAIVFATIYSAILLSSLDIIVPLLLGVQYKGTTTIVAAWCLFIIFQYSRTGSSVILQIFKEFKSLTVINSITLLFAIFTAATLIKYVGIAGAILGSALGELLLSVWLYKLVFQYKSGSQ
ncbi:MAG: hypothetical protein H7240_00125 [Glaciimonas sp.]|nr:hypothetical protein [Glaciimonas sp.]